MPYEESAEACEELPDQVGIFGFPMWEAVSPHSQPTEQNDGPLLKRQTLQARSPEREKIAELTHDVLYYKEVGARARKEVRHLKGVARDQIEQIAQVNETLASQSQTLTQMRLDYQGMVWPSVSQEPVLTCGQRNLNEQLVHMLQKVTAELNLKSNLQIQYDQVLPVPRAGSVTSTRGFSFSIVPSNKLTVLSERILPAVPFALPFTFFVLHAGMQGGWAVLVVPYLLCVAAFYL
ncbi:hypothetical protein R3P38DRAFT_2764702 [Favolaschia claudopus]|uniref:Uncharacterized protein n=1 Tax=Favolaschia claudopus TaxID=2862362 RepID=A0AAW0DCE1_9AGAR